MPEEVIFESESERSRTEVADYLRTVAARLEDGGNLSLRAGAEDLSLSVPDRVTFEVKAERETSTGGAESRSIEFELEWSTGDGESDLEIE